MPFAAGRMRPCSLRPSLVGVDAGDAGAPGVSPHCAPAPQNWGTTAGSGVRTRGWRVRARASPSSPSSERAQLQRELAAAVAAEDYQAAARLKASLARVEAADPLLSLQRALQEAVAAERYEDAAVLRRQLEVVAAESTGPEALASLPTTSNTATHGIRVRVRSFFMPNNSSPAQGRYFWGYAVTITNESDRVVQLRNRHWVIVDERGHREEVKGPGVVGAQPVLLPGKTYEYNSGCPLSVPSGSMQGSYTFVVLDETDGRFKDTIEVAIGRFKLAVQEQPGP